MWFLYFHFQDTPTNDNDLEDTPNDDDFESGHPIEMVC